MHLNKDDSLKLATALAMLVFSHMDCCNSMVVSLPKETLKIYIKASKISLRIKVILGTSKLSSSTDSPMVAHSVSQVNVWSCWWSSNACMVLPHHTGVNSSLSDGVVACITLQQQQRACSSYHWHIKRLLRTSCGPKLWNVFLPDHLSDCNCLTIIKNLLVLSCFQSVINV